MQRKRTLAIGITALLLASPALGAHHEKAARKAQGSAAEAVDDGAAAMDEATGKAKGAAMQERRDQRKAIMEEAKEGAEPGTPREGKKPWWKFWGADGSE